MPPRGPRGLSAYPLGHTFRLTSLDPQDILFAGNALQQESPITNPISIRLLRPLGYAVRCAQVQVIGPTKEASFTAQSPSETQAASRAAPTSIEREGGPHNLLLNFSPHCCLAFAKFFQIDNKVQAKSLRNELSVYTDHQMQALGYSDSSIIADRGPLVIPRFEGLFTVAPNQGDPSPLAYSHVLLLYPIHPLFVSLSTLGCDENEEIKRRRLQTVCLALKGFHDFGYVHGDISDGNILYSREDETKVVLLDFEKSRWVALFLSREFKFTTFAGTTATNP